jgi:hypothetical protein
MCPITPISLVLRTNWVCLVTDSSALFTVNKLNAQTAQLFTATLSLSLLCHITKYFARWAASYNLSIHL